MNKRKMTRQIMIIASFVFVCALALAVRLDYKSVRLEYVSKVAVTPPVTEFYGEEVTYYWIAGERIKEKLEKELFPQRYADSYTLKGRSHPVPKKYTIRWEENFVPEDGAVYYIGLGCEIERITYFFHTKYFTFTSDPSSGMFIIHSASVRPLKDRSVITIYKGDAETVYGP